MSNNELMSKREKPDPLTKDQLSLLSSLMMQAKTLKR